MLILLSALLNLTSGHLSLSVHDIVNVFLGRGSQANQLLLIQFRLPRLLIALLVGAGMGVAGAILQGVTQNSLADPGILGIHSGAGFAVVSMLSLTAADGSHQTGIGFLFTLPVIAFIGGISAAALIYFLSWKNGVSPIRLLLTGIGVNAGFAAALMLLQLRTTEASFHQATVWLSGSIWNAHWNSVWSLIPWIGLLLPITFYQARSLNILYLGDEIASGLGISVEKERMKWLLLAVALSSASVSVAGGIAFIGLGAPHLAKRLVGGNLKRSLLVSALLGSVLLIVSDSIARTLFAPSEVPVGLVVSVIGAPYFLYLLMTVED
jgi:iron complex transport system permease protein